MKKPKLESNKIQSFIEFDSIGKPVKMGCENDRIFLEVNEVKTKLMDGDGFKYFGIDDIARIGVRSGKVVIDMLLTDGSWDLAQDTGWEQVAEFGQP